MAPQKPQPRPPHPVERAKMASKMNKKGMTAIKNTYQFGEDCDTPALLVYYNKVHEFWDGAAFIPIGESLPENMNDVIQDVWQRQIVSDGKLVLRTARLRKQPAEVKSCRVTKPAHRPSARVLSLRGRRRADDSQSGRSDSPTQPEIIVACDEFESRSDTVYVASGSNDHDDGSDDDDHDGEGESSRLCPSHRDSRAHSEPTELRNAATSHAHHHHLLPHDRDTVVSCAHIAGDEDAEGELWTEAIAPLAPMVTNTRTDDVAWPGHSNEPGSTDLTMMMADDDDWMQSAMMNFDDMGGLSYTQDLNDMLAVGLDDMNLDMNMDTMVDMDMDMDRIINTSAGLNNKIMDQLDSGQLLVDMISPSSRDSNVVAQVSTEVRADADAGGSMKANAIADADTDNNVPQTLQPSAMIGSDDHMSSNPLKRINEAQIPSTSHETDHSLQPTVIYDRPDNPGHAAATENGRRPGLITGSQLLAIITRALSQMSVCEDADRDVDYDAGWPMKSQDLVDMPLVMPACSA